MDAIFRSKLLQEAIRIGDELVATAIPQKVGCLWETLGLDNDLKSFWRTSENSYNGVSGIVLFLLELCKQTQSEKYLHAAEEGMRWVEMHCQSTPSSDYSFYCGRMSVSFAFVKLFELTQEPAYLDQALSIAKPAVSFLTTATHDDLLVGTAGALLGLLHLHAATQEKWVLESINTFTEHLLKRMQPGQIGVYWDRSAENIRGLCGFSHGASGLAFVFLEMGHYFQNEAFYQLAEQALAYENQYYEPSVNNWTDFRLSIGSQKTFEEHRDRYLRNDVRFFSERKYMNAWCHGAAGIGLARLRAFELLGKASYAAEAYQAIEKTRQTDIESQHALPSFTLCHGKGGNAELFLEAYRVLDDRTCLQLAETVAQQALTAKEQGQPYQPGYHLKDLDEDRSLFIGNAGIGYFYLRLLAPLSVPSIQCPVVQAVFEPQDLSSYPALSITSRQVHQLLVSKVFPRTLQVLGQLRPVRVKQYFEESLIPTQTSFKSQFVAWVHQVMNELAAEASTRLNEIVRLEEAKKGLDDGIESDAWLRMKKVVQSERATELLQLSDEQLAERCIVLESEIELRETQWNWELAAPPSWIENLQKAAGSHTLCWQPTALGIVECYLSSPSRELLHGLQKPQSIQTVIEALLLEFELHSIEEEQTLRNILLTQIRRAIQAGIVVEATTLVSEPLDAQVFSYFNTAAN